MAGRFLLPLMSVVEALLLPRLVVGLPRLADLLGLRLRRHRHVPPREAGDRGQRLDADVDEAGLVLLAGLRPRPPPPLLPVGAPGGPPPAPPGWPRIPPPPPPRGAAPPGPPGAGTPSAT